MASWGNAAIGYPPQRNLKIRHNRPAIKQTDLAAFTILRSPDCAQDSDALQQVITANADSPQIVRFKGVSISSRGQQGFGSAGSGRSAHACYASAVVGSVSARTWEIRFTGKPPHRACSLINSTDGAM